MLSEHVYCVAITFKMTEEVEQWICIKFCVKLEHSSSETIRIIQKAASMGNWWLPLHHNNVPLMHHISCRVFWCNIKSLRWLIPPPHSPDLVPCDFWLFPKLNSALKGKRFQTVNEIQENIMRKLMATGRTVWGPKVPTLKGTEASLPYVQCFLYLVYSSINVSIFHIIWLDPFWITYISIFIYVYTHVHVMYN